MNDQLSPVLPEPSCHVADWPGSRIGSLFPVPEDGTPEHYSQEDMPDLGSQVKAPGLAGLLSTCCPSGCQHREVQVTTGIDPSSRVAVSLFQCCSSYRRSCLSERSQAIASNNQGSSSPGKGSPSPGSQCPRVCFQPFKEYREEQGS